MQTSTPCRVRCSAWLGGVSLLGRINTGNSYHNVKDAPIPKRNGHERVSARRRIVSALRVEITQHEVKNDAVCRSHGIARDEPPTPWCCDGRVVSHGANHNLG